MIKLKSKIILILLFLFTSFLFYGCQLKKNDRADLGLNTVSNAEKLKSLIASSNQQFDDFYRSNWLTEGGPEVADEAPGENYTKTNVQVEGVDEGDVAKTDGKRIYSIARNEVHVVETDENGNLEIILSETLQSEDAQKQEDYYTYYSELYLTDRYFLVIGQKYQYHIFDFSFNGIVPEVGCRWYFSTPITIVDIYDIESLEKVKSFEISGNLMGSRLINDNLYLFSSHNKNYYFLEDESFDPRPWITEDGEAKVVDYENIKYLSDSIYQSFTMITNVKLDTEITYETDTLLGASYWGTIYVSTEAIYFAYSSWEPLILGQYTETGRILSYQFEDDGNLYFGGTGTYKGSIINQFSIDEYNGYLRIVTTEGWSQSVTNRLYIFERVLENGAYILKPVGLIDKGLGKPGERVQSVRFNKDLATVVTYQQVDPLYTIDVSDPYNPTIKGALEIPGFSTYQHPWGENYLLGIGYDADDRFTTGLKLSLFDISDINKPKEVGLPLIFSYNEYRYSEALHNHKALYIDPEYNCFGFSIQAWNRNLQQDYLVFDVNPQNEQPITVRYKINHDFYQEGEVYYGYNSMIQRSFRIGEYLYAVSNIAVTSHNLVGEFSTVDYVVFE